MIVKTQNCYYIHPYNTNTSQRFKCGDFTVDTESKSKNANPLHTILLGNHTPRILRNEDYLQSFQIYQNPKIR